MSEPVILVKKDNNVATITLNRPERMNALNREMIEELIRTVAEIKQDTTVRAVVLTGAGRTFCTGAELVHPFLGLTNAAEIRQFMERGNTIVFTLRTMEKPVITAVNGAAVGAGCSLALAGDIIIASEKARFGLGFTAVGVHPDNGITYLLPRLVGSVRASELMLTNRIIDANEAERIGMVNQVVSPELLETTVKKLASGLAEGPPIAIALTKNSLNQSLGMDLVSMLELETKAQSICFLTEDCKEGAEAFLQKRKPIFKGK